MISETRRYALWRFAKDSRQKGLTLFGCVESATKYFGLLNEEEQRKLTEFYNGGV